MRPIFGLLVLILTLYFNEIETSNFGRDNLPQWIYSEEDRRRINPLATSRLPSNAHMRNSMLRSQSSTRNEALDLQEPHQQGSGPDTSLQLGLPGAQPDHPGGSGNRNDEQQPFPWTYWDPPPGYRNNINQQHTYHQNLHHDNQLNYQSRSSTHMDHSGGSGYGNHLQSNQYGQIVNLPQYADQIDQSAGSGYGDTRAVHQQATTHFPQDPYVHAWPKEKKKKSRNTN